MNVYDPQKKSLVWDIVEQRILTLANVYTGTALQTNQRVYFGPNTRLKGKTLIGIDLLAEENPFNLQDLTILSVGQLNSSTLSLVNTKKDEVVKDFPLQDLSRFNTFGKIKLMNLKIDLESSYVVITTPAGLPANAAIVFNFYTTDVE